MNSLSIKRGKISTTIYGVKEPVKIAIPRRIRINPTYMGFLVNRNTPFVISMVDSWNGLTVVLALLKALSAKILSTHPVPKGISPNKFQGNGQIFANGKRKCRRAVIIIATSTYIGGKIFLLFIVVSFLSYSVVESLEP
jgi:hypothetical protein